MDWLRAPCIIWHKAIKDNGYGVIWVNRRLEHAHRFYYELVNGPVPIGFELDHLCRNRACINPDHLEVVTRAVNTQRGRRAKLTAEQVRALRSRYATGGITMRALAAEYHVGVWMVNHIIHRRSWANVA